MSDTTPAPQPQAPHALSPHMHAVFSEDFWPQQVDGEETDLSDTGLLLTTLCRTAEGAGESFGAGALTEVLAWSADGGIHLRKVAEGYIYDSYKGMTDWAEVKPAWGSHKFTGTPVVATHNEIMRGLSLLGGVAWYGIRYHETNRWAEGEGPARLPDAKPRDGAMHVLQIDVLLKGHKQPHGRLALLYESGAFHAWTDADDNYLMAFMADSGNTTSHLQMIRFGEAFLIA